MRSSVIIKTAKKLTAIALLLLSVVLAACDFDESRYHLYGGKLLNDEMISEIKNEIFSGATFESETVIVEEYETVENSNDIPMDVDVITETQKDVVSGDELYETNPNYETNENTLSVDSVEITTEKISDAEQTNTVYWTKSGSVWHTRSDCYHIKKSSNVFSGTLDEAIEAGKEKLCSSCGK